MLSLRRLNDCSQCSSVACVTEALIELLYHCVWCVDVEQHSVAVWMDHKLKGSSRLSQSKESEVPDRSAAAAFSLINETFHSPCFCTSSIKYATDCMDHGAVR